MTKEEILNETTFEEVLEERKSTNIYAKLLKVKSEIGTLTKKADNPFFKSKYLDLSDLLEAVEPVLEKHGLVLLQPIDCGLVSTEIYDIEDGKRLVSSMQLPTINDPQKLGSAVTYYRRYTLQSLLGLQAEDDDANTASQATKNNKAWVNQNDKIWNAALDKGVKLDELKKHYNISRINAELYPFK